MSWLGPIVLNDEVAVPNVAPAAAAENLQESMLALIGRFTVPDGRLDYQAVRGSWQWGEAVARAAALKAVDLRELTGRPARLAFWINVYNALVFHGIVALEIRRTTREVRGFYRRVSYRVGRLVLSADDIEHGMLRDNARPGWLRRRRFARRDPRRALAIRPMDPRIHFAITCGAQSCPPIGVYRAEAIDEQLDTATRSFVNQAVTLEGKTVTCSRILRWYLKDFAAAGGLGAFLTRHLDAGPVREAIGGRAHPCRAYRRYDWALQHEPVE